MIGRPPSSTPFPYTTLFRSAPDPTQPSNSRAARSIHREPAHEPISTGGPPRAAGQTGSSEADRKSTRLNSSHSQISYAVFCLKKKNHIVDIQRHHADAYPRP